VYNPHIESARNFAEEFELESYDDDYDRFLDKVNAVYIASPHATHYEYAKKALEKGKNVMVEKPMTLKKSEAIELFDLANKNNCILMEAIKTAYAPGFIRLIATAKSGQIGEIKDVEACFTKLTPDGTREFKDVDFGGSFTELASYTLLPIVKIFGDKYEELNFVSFNSANHLDGYTKAYFRFKNGCATSKTGLKVKSEGQLIISGTRGYIRVTAPWWKTSEFEICYEDSTQNEKVFIPFKGDGLRYEISDFVSAVNGYRNNSFKLTAMESIALASIIEQFLNSRNVDC
jgi:choline-phosphate cytidylyltransferase